MATDTLYLATDYRGYGASSSPGQLLLPTRLHPAPWSRLIGPKRATATKLSFAHWSHENVSVGGVVPFVQFLCQSQL
ncbi:hypothetical protein AOLI_G00167550 [Acnodon oligacanthus]